MKFNLSQPHFPTSANNVSNALCITPRDLWRDKRRIQNEAKKMSDRFLDLVPSRKEFWQMKKLLMGSLSVFVLYVLHSSSSCLGEQHFLVK